MVQSRDWVRIITCAPVDKDHCASFHGRAVRPLVDIVRELLGLTRFEVHLIYEANINAVLTEKLF